MGRLPRAVPSAVLCLAIAALPPPDAPAQEPVLHDAVGGISGDRLATRTQITPDPYAPGDTIGVRVVLYNLTDETLPLESPACGLAFGEGLAAGPDPGGEKLDARLVVPEEGCPVPQTRLEPVDSIAVTARAVVLSPPGRYVLSIEPPRPTSGPRSTMYGRGVKVVPPGARESRPAEPGTPARTLRYTLRVHDPGSQPMTERDVHRVIQEAIRQAGGFALPMTDAAAPLAPPYLFVEVEGAPRRVQWVCGEAPEPGLAFLGEGRPPPPDSRSLFVEGGSLALMVRSSAERAMEERTPCP